MRPIAPSIYNVGISTEGEFFASENALGDLNNGILRLEAGGNVEQACVEKLNILSILRLLGEKNRRLFKLAPEMKSLVYGANDAERRARTLRLMELVNGMKKKHPDIFPLTIDFTKESAHSDSMRREDVDDVSRELEFFDIELYISFTKAVKPAALAQDLERAGLVPVIKSLFDATPAELAIEATVAKLLPIERVKEEAAEPEQVDLEDLRKVLPGKLDIRIEPEMTVPAATMSLRALPAITETGMVLQNLDEIIEKELKERASHLPGA